jgi:hypothetical protein
VIAVGTVDVIQLRQGREPGRPRPALPLRDPECGEIPASYGDASPMLRAAP